jgi:predicted DNA-binding antitoxin AbrB/MazE fold protein
MVREIRARYSRGVIEPLEKLELDEGEEVIISVKDVSTKPVPGDALERTAGGWEGLVDTDQLLKDFAESRKITRPEVRL